MKNLGSIESVYKAFPEHNTEKQIFQPEFICQDCLVIDGFLSFSLSIQIMGKSPACYTLGNHLEKVFELMLFYSRGEKI